MFLWLSIMLQSYKIIIQRHYFPIVQCTNTPFQCMNRELHLHFFIIRSSHSAKNYITLSIRLRIHPSKQTLFHTKPPLSESNLTESIPCVSSSLISLPSRSFTCLRISLFSSIVVYFLITGSKIKAWQRDNPT